MPSTRRWSVPPKRIAATAVLGVIGIFLVCGSVGMGAWLVGAIGIAVIAVGAGVLVLSALNSRATSEIEGTAHVLSASAPPSGVTHGRCRLNLVLYGKGISGVGVKIRDAAVPVAKWPDAGTELPVMISIDKPQRTRVLWGDVATHREAAEERARAREAQDEAAAMAAEADEYANLDAALDNLDLDSDMAHQSATARAEPPLGDGAGEPPPAEAGAGDPFGSESSAGEAYRAGGEPAMATSGTRTIEMDVMDPSVMRWTGPPPGRPYGSRPSPFRRRRPERPAPAPEPAPDESPPDAIDAPPPLEAEPVPAEAEPASAEAGPAAAEAESVAVSPVDGDTVAVSSFEGETGVAADNNDAAAVPPAPPSAPPSAPTVTSIESALMIDNGQLVAFDLFEPAPPVSPAAGATSRSVPPEWPPRSAAAAAAAAALPHQWDDEDVDDRVDAGDEGDPEFAARHVPRNRPVPADELFDQDALDDGPGYSPDTAYADDAEYDPDAGYSTDAGYAEPGQPNSAS